MGLSPEKKPKKPSLMYILRETSKMDLLRKWGPISLCIFDFTTSIGVIISQLNIPESPPDSKLTKNLDLFVEMVAFELGVEGRMCWRMGGEERVLLRNSKEGK